MTTTDKTFGVKKIKDIKLPFLVNFDTNFSELIVTSCVDQLKDIQLEDRLCLHPYFIVSEKLDFNNPVSEVDFNKLKYISPTIISLKDSLQSFINTSKITEVRPKSIFIMLWIFFMF